MYTTIYLENHFNIMNVQFCLSDYQICHLKSHFQQKYIALLRALVWKSWPKDLDTTFWSSNNMFIYNTSLYSFYSGKSSSSPNKLCPHFFSFPQFNFHNDGGIACSSAPHNLIWVISTIEVGVPTWGVPPTPTANFSTVGALIQVIVVVICSEGRSTLPAQATCIKSTGSTVVCDS